MAELQARTAEGARLAAEAESLSPTTFWGKVALPQRAIDVALGKIAGVLGPSDRPISEQARAAFVPGGHQETTALDVAAGLPAAQLGLAQAAPKAARFTEATLGPLVETGAQMATDPTNLVFAGLSKYGRAGAALQGLLGAAFAGHMGKEGLAAGKQAIETFMQDGITPAGVEQATHALVAIGGAVLGALGGVVGLKETVAPPPKFAPRELAAQRLAEMEKGGAERATYREALEKARKVWEARKAAEGRDFTSQMEAAFPELAGIENTAAIEAMFPELKGAPQEPGQLQPKAAELKKAIARSKAAARAGKAVPAAAEPVAGVAEAAQAPLSVLEETVPSPPKTPMASDLPPKDLGELYSMGYRPLDVRSMPLEEAQALLAGRRRAFAREEPTAEPPTAPKPDEALQGARPTAPEPTDEAVNRYLQASKAYLERYRAPKGRLELRTAGPRAKEELGFDVPELAGLGEKKIAEIIAAGPDHVAYGRVFRAAKRAVAATEEAQAAPGEAQPPQVEGRPQPAPSVAQGAQGGPSPDLLAAAAEAEAAVRGPGAAAPAESPGGQPAAVEAAPGGALSGEELMRAARREQYWKISRSGEVTYQGAQPDPTRALRPGEAIIRTLPGREPSVVQANALPDTAAIEAFQRTDAWKGIVARAGAAAAARRSETGALVFGGGPLAGHRVRLPTGEEAVIRGVEPNGRLRVVVGNAERSVRAGDVDYLGPAAPTRPAAPPLSLTAGPVAPRIPGGEYEPPARVARLMRAPAQERGLEPRTLGERARYVLFGERPEPQGAAPQPPAASSPAVQKLLARLDYLSREQAATTRLRRPEVARRAGVAAGEMAARPSIEGAMRARGRMRGELPTAEMRAAPPWTPEDTDAIVSTLVSSGGLAPYEQVNAAFAVRDAMAGKRVTRYYRQLLRRALGDQAADAIESARPWLKYTDLAADLVNLPRALIASFDMSAPLRQGLLISAAHPAKAAKAFAQMHRMFVDSGAYDKFVQGLRADPDVALFLENRGHVASLGRGEEIFRSQVAERLPVLGRGVRASERAFVGYLDKITIDVWKDSVARLRSKGLTPEAAPGEYADLAAWLNVARGRGELPGRSGAIADELGQALFSPRLAAARVQTPYYAGKALLSALPGADRYVTMGKAARMEIARSLAGTVALGLGFLGYLKANGWQVQDDPEHVDFGRARKGHLRLDPWGGFQPYARFAVTMWRGQRKTMAGETARFEGKLPYRETRLSQTLRFIEQKASPQVRPLLNFWNARQDIVTGKPVTVGSTLYQTFVPMVGQDIIEAMQQEGLDASLLAGGFSFYGGGVAAYRTPEEAVRERVESHKRQNRVLTIAERYRKAAGLPPEEETAEPSGGHEYFRALR